MRLILGLGLLGDGLLLAFLIAMSGYVFGAQEGMRGEWTAVAVWGAAVLAVMTSAVGAVVLKRRGRVEQAAVVAIAPSLAALLAGIASI